MVRRHANTDTRFSIDNQPLLPRAASPHYSVRRDKVPFPQRGESRPATVVCGRLRECKPFLRLLLCPRQRSGSPSPAIAPVEHGPASQLARNKLPARSAAAVTQRAGAERRTRASGLTAAADRAHRRCLPVSGKRSLLQVAWCMRSGAVVCPASLIAAYHPPRACMEIRRSGPKSLQCARRHLTVAWFSRPRPR